VGGDSGISTTFDKGLDKIHSKVARAGGAQDTAGDPKADAPHGWKTSTPASQNVDRLKVTRAFRQARTSSYLQSLLVIRNGKLLGEEYFNGFDANTSNCIKSCTNVFTSALVGNISISFSAGPV
jgi:hypothetical protein